MSAPRGAAAHARGALPGARLVLRAGGAKRRGFLVHRSVRGESPADRERLAEAGLAVADLERDGRLVIAEFDPDEPPESSPAPWEEALRTALADGFTALWYSRFAIEPEDEGYVKVMPFERAWDRTFAGQPVVTLCPYVVGELDGATTLDRLTGVAAVHEGVLVAGDEGVLLLPTSDALAPGASPARAS